MIAIVTDSTAYLTKQEAADLGVRVVPITYTVSGQLYHESYCDHNGDFETLLSSNSGRCSTAQTSVAVFMSVFEELIRNNYEVFCLVISSRLSGVYSSASVAARELNSDKIIVVDSLTTGGALSLLVKAAKALADQNLPLSELAAAIEQRRNDVGIAFSVDSMEALRRSGRLGIVKQSVGTMLNIRPILMCQDGVVVSYGVSRGKAQQIKALLNLIPENAKSVIVHYLGEKMDPEPMILAIKNQFKDAEVLVRRLGPVLGIHIGLGVIGAAWIKK